MSARRRYPPIPRVHARDREDASAARSFLARGRPVVIRTTDAEQRRAWEPEALRTAFGGHEVDAEETNEVYVGTRPQHRLSLEHLLDRVLAGDRTLRWKGLDLLAALPGMHARVAAHPPSSDAFLPPRTESTRRALWLAPPGTMSSLHHDGNSDNFNWQVHGKKLFLLVPPSRKDCLYAYGSAESPINPFRPELARFPRFGHADPVEATLEPGDVLLIPKYWWHCVYSIEPSINLNTWFTFRGELSPWRALAGAPLLYRSASSVAAELKRRRLHGVARATRRLWYAAYARVTERPAPEPRGELIDP
ncbi:MAG: cupin-like domain-containing protein [Labilithrix sp.]